MNCIKTGVHCLHYIEHQDCTATWAMSEISEEKLNKYTVVRLHRRDCTLSRTSSMVILYRTYLKMSLLELHGQLFARGILSTSLVLAELLAPAPALVWGRLF